EVEHRGGEGRRVHAAGGVGEDAETDGRRGPRAAGGDEGGGHREEAVGQLGQQARLLGGHEGAGRVGPEEVGRAARALLLERRQQLGVGAVADLHVEAGLLTEALHERVHEDVFAAGVDDEAVGLGGALGRVGVRRAGGEGDDEGGEERPEREARHGWRGYLDSIQRVRTRVRAPRDFSGKGRYRPSASRAAATTASAVSPRPAYTSSHGPLAPNRSSPTTRPPIPTYLYHPSVAPASTPTRAVTAGGSTASRY